VIDRTRGRAARPNPKDDQGFRIDLNGYSARSNGNLDFLFIDEESESVVADFHRQDRLHDGLELADGNLPGSTPKQSIPASGILGRIEHFPDFDRQGLGLKGLLDQVALRGLEVLEYTRSPRYILFFR
jgi:hypothetical protein